MSKRETPPRDFRFGIVLQHIVPLASHFDSIPQLVGFRLLHHRVDPFDSNQGYLSLRSKNTDLPLD